MPTRRARRTRARIETDVPDWARRLLEGKRPATEAWVPWLYFDEEIVGLPVARSAEGQKLIDRVGGVLGECPLALIRRDAN